MACLGFVVANSATLFSLNQSKRLEYMMKLFVSVYTTRKRVSQVKGRINVQCRMSNYHGRRTNIEQQISNNECRRELQKEKMVTLIKGDANQPGVGVVFDNGRVFIVQ